MKSSAIKSSNIPAIPVLPEKSKWTVVAYKNRDPRTGRNIWYCRCACQPPNSPATAVREDHLKFGRSISCGCTRWNAPGWDRIARGHRTHPQGIENKDANMRQISVLSVDSSAKERAVFNKAAIELQKTNRAARELEKLGEHVQYKQSQPADVEEVLKGHDLGMGRGLTRGNGKNMVYVGSTHDLTMLRFPKSKLKFRIPYDPERLRVTSIARLMLCNIHGPNPVKSESGRGKNKKFELECGCVRSKKLEKHDG